MYPTVYFTLHVLTFDIELMQLLLKYGADVHIDDDYPLIHASEAREFKAVLLLLQYGADVSKVTTQKGRKHVAQCQKILAFQMKREQKRKESAQHRNLLLDDVIESSKQ